MSPDRYEPGAGAAAAETVLLAANLCEQLAAGAAEWEHARGVAVQASHLKSRAGAALDQNVAAYAAARRQLAISPGSETGRDAMLAAALLASVDSLLAIGTVAADTAALAAEMAAQLPADVRADAYGAAELAVGAASVVSELVAINLALGLDDPRRERARAILAGARASSDSARRALLD